MNNKELFKQAILDAKSVREVALANAKKALEESLTPRLQSMLAAKLQEMEEESLEETEELEEKKQNFGSKAFKKVSPKGSTLRGPVKEEESIDEDLDLDEILAELELEEGGEGQDQATNSLKENFDDTNETMDDGDETENAQNPSSDEKIDDADEDPLDSDSDDMGDEGISDDEQISSLTVGELKDLLKSAVAEAGMGAEDGLGDEVPTGDDMNDMPSDTDLEEPTHSHAMEEEIDLDELLKELEGLEPTNEANKVDGKTPKKAKSQDIAETEEKVQEIQKELNEAVRTIKTLRKDLNEVNLLNAKLLYVNKIFKAKNLNESQKAKIILSFDKARSVKETKLVYETLVGSIKNTSKKPITESRGFASKPAGVAKQQPIIDSQIDRWQFLAGIKK